MKPFKSYSRKKVEGLKINNKKKKRVSNSDFVTSFLDTKKEHVSNSDFVISFLDTKPEADVIRKVSRNPAEASLLL